MRLLVAVVSDKSSHPVAADQSFCTELELQSVVSAVPGTSMKLQLDLITGLWFDSFIETDFRTHLMG
jgi:hypothetical protein